MSRQLSGYSIGLLQGTAYSRLHTKLTKVLYQLSLTIPEWKLLGQMYEHKKLKLSTLAEFLSYDPPMVTKLVKQIEKRGLVKREQDYNDERVKIIHITTEGGKLIENAEPEVKKAMKKMLDGITREELNTYIKVLTAIVKNTNAS